MLAGWAGARQQAYALVPLLDGVARCLRVRELHHTVWTTWQSLTMSIQNAAQTCTKQCKLTLTHCHVYELLRRRDLQHVPRVRAHRDVDQGWKDGSVTALPARMARISAYNFPFRLPIAYTQYPSSRILSCAGTR